MVTFVRGVRRVRGMRSVRCVDWHASVAYAQSGVAEGEESAGARGEEG